MYGIVLIQWQFQLNYDEPLIEPERLRDVREFWRWGITNSGAGCRVHCGGIEFAEGCRAKNGLFFCITVGPWTDCDRAGAGILFRGGIAGGGPRVVLVMGVWYWVRGGICGSCVSLSFTWSVVDICLDVMLDVLCRIADFAFDMDWAMEVCTVVTEVEPDDILVKVFWVSFVPWSSLCVWSGFEGTLLETCAGNWAFVSKIT